MQVRERAAAQAVRVALVVALVLVEDPKVEVRLGAALAHGIGQRFE